MIQLSWLELPEQLVHRQGVILLGLKSSLDHFCPIVYDPASARASWLDHDHRTGVQLWCPRLLISIISANN
jgi:hypothetical protein